MTTFQFKKLTRVVNKFPGVSIKLPEGLKNKFLSFGIVEILPNSRTSGHSHDTGEEFFFVIDGEGTLLLDKKKYILKKGDIIFIKEKARHQIINNSDAKLRFLFGISPPLNI